MRIVHDVDVLVLHLAPQALEAAWERAKSLWEKLRPETESEGTAEEVTQHVAQDPDDEHARAALRLQLKKLLAADTALKRLLPDIILDLRA